MQLTNYTLKIKNKLLINDATFSFEAGKISHIVGKNGTGKSSFAKDLLMNNSRKIPKDIQHDVTVLSSFSNIPTDLKVKTVLEKLQTGKRKKGYDDLYNLLNIQAIDANTLIGNLSDGQKQKMKILAFLLEDKKIIVLDELTNALDKKTTLEIYEFLNEYIAQNSSKYILNITHNLQDLEHLPGNYYLLQEQKINMYNDKDFVINQYIKGA
jgi:putative peptide transport system ATP-binding protein